MRHPFVGILVAALAPSFSHAGDKVGPETCKACHPSAYEAWLASPHARARDSLPERSRNEARCLSCHAPDLEDGISGVSCETCHVPEKGWTDALPFSTKFDGSVNTRHTPTMYGVAFYPDLYWDGRSKGLEVQVPAAWKGQMGADPDAIFREFSENTKQFDNLVVFRGESAEAAAQFPDGYFATKDRLAYAVVVRVKGDIFGERHGEAVSKLVRQTIGQQPQLSLHICV